MAPTSLVYLLPTWEDPASASILLLGSTVLTVRADLGSPTTPLVLATIPGRHVVMLNNHTTSYPLSLSQLVYVDVQWGNDTGSKYLPGRPVSRRR